MTRGVGDKMKQDAEFGMAITDYFQRYVNCDWGDLCEEDKEMNEVAVLTGEGRILASCNTKYGKVWIITEWDRSVTTVLFADEY